MSSRYWLISRVTEKQRAFTLIELTAVLALTATLTGLASLMLAGTGRRAQFQNACDQVLSVDAVMRDSTRRSNRASILSIDLANASFLRNGGGETDSRILGQLNQSLRVELILIDGHREGSGVVNIAYSAGGRSSSFALLITGPQRQRQWILMNGFTGQAIYTDDSELDQIFDATK